MDKTTITTALQTSSPKEAKRKRAPKDKALKLYTPKASNPVTDLIDKASSLASSSSSSSASSSNPNSKMLLESIIIGRRRRTEMENERKQGTAITTANTASRTKESLIEWAQNSDHLKLNFKAIIAFLNDESHPIHASPFTTLQSMLDMQSFNGSQERKHFYQKRKRAWKELHSVAMPFLEQQRLKASTMDRETEIVCNDLREHAKKSKRLSSSGSGSGKKGGKAAGRGKRSTSNTSSSPPSPSPSPHPSSTAASGEPHNANSQPRHLPPDVLERLGLERVKVWRIITNQRQQGKTAKVFHQNLTNRQSNAKKVAQLCQREQRKLSLRLVSRADRELMLRCRRLAKDQASFWRKFEREEREGRKRAERDLLEERRKEEELREERRQARKLQFLVNQTELYSHFVAGTKKNTDIAGTGGTKLTASCDLADVSEADIKEHAEHLASEAYKSHKKKMEVFEGDGVDAVGNGGGGGVVDGANVATTTNTTTTATATATNNMVTQPIMLQATLKPYQLKGLSWLSSLYEQGINGILADEMGLGKTIQAISLMAHIVERHGIYGPFLVVAPASTLHNWQQEIQRFIPSLRALPYWGTVAERKSLRSFWRWTGGGTADAGGGISTLPLGAPQSANLRHKYTKDSPFHILITSYQLIVTDAAYLSKEKWQYMILDEAQALKSSQSQRWKTLLSFQCRNRLLLTGTPIQNGMQELWALLHFIMPTLFDSHDEFADWFSKDIESHSTTSTSSTSTSTVSKLNSFQLNRLHMILKPFMLRRTKMEVIHELAPKTEIDILCHLSPRQKTLTRRLRKGLPMMMAAKNGGSNGGPAGGGDTTSTLMNLMMQLRKTCNHPLLFGSSSFKSPFVMSEREPYWYGRGNVPGTSTSMARYWKAPLVRQPEWLPCLLKLMMQKDSPSLSPFVISAANDVGFIGAYGNNDIGVVGTTTTTETETAKTTETKTFSSLIDSVDLQTALPLKKLIGWKPACQRVDAVGDGDLLELPDLMQSLLLDSGKMVELDRLLVELRKGDHRVLLYNQMTKMIDIMEEYLQWRRFSYLRLDGSNKISERRDLVHEWQTGDAFIFLLSTRAGGLGINLTSADTVIFYDSDWNPTVDQQAMDRSHRLGQTKPVTVYRLITKNSVEERMRERALQKGEIHNVVIAGGKFEHDDVGGYADVGDANGANCGASNISTTTATATTTSNTPDREELQSLLMDDDDI